MQKITREEERRVEKIIERFIKKHYSFLNKKNLEKKKKELEIGYQGIFRRGVKIYLVLRLPEGILAVIGENGNFRDISENDFL